MDELTLLLKKEIKRQFKSVRRFSLEIGVPQSTIVTSLQKGVGGTSFSTIMLMCDALNIKPVFGEKELFLDRESRVLLQRYAQLDERGKQTVRALTEIEALRSTDDPLYAELGRRLDEQFQKSESNS